jgi:hypothetical protein
MQEIESKRKLRASEGAHFFFTLIFLTASGLLQLRYTYESCFLNLRLLADLVFYGLVIWATYLLISIVPRYKNPAIKIFFNFLDLVFGIYLFVLFIFANTLYFSTGYETCFVKAPVLTFFTELFLIVTWVLFAVLGLAIIAFIFRRFSKSSSGDYEENQ